MALLKDSGCTMEHATWWHSRSWYVGETPEDEKPIQVRWGGKACNSFGLQIAWILDPTQVQRNHCPLWIRILQVFMCATLCGQITPLRSFKYYTNDVDMLHLPWTPANISKQTFAWFFLKNKAAKCLRSTVMSCHVYSVSGGCWNDKGEQYNH